ncbi:membrane protein insertase YidC [Chondromyces apiculatus]|uniref:Membrane protein insertase YidC n=1 Tax=Chondromyces apiculatus DSM 436 TaxID=1192034 RepID=A0A017T441_9BACT|nr:membrane protein insertase YidC [Chondromyces apiculatus]EYF03550.1 Inner membrane protein translocase component YidC, long form [Chondromyces apiculatus DSM 436]
MERSNLLKWLFIGLVALLFIQFGPKLFGESKVERQPFGTLRDDVQPPQRGAEEVCVIDGERFKAELSSRGGSLRHFWLTLPKYQVTRDEGGKEVTRPIDLVSTSAESRMPLRTDLRQIGDAPHQVPYNDLDWKLTAQDGKRCTFTYTDATSELVKDVAATGKPYELAVTVSVKNLAAEPRKHRLAIEQTAYHAQHETTGSFLQPTTEWATETVASTNERTDRQLPTDFEPKDFEDKEFTSEKWRRTPGEGRFSAVSSSYFSAIAIPLEGPPTAAETQIEEIWDSRRHKKQSDDPNHGFVYRARIAYPEAELAPQGTTTYKALSYVGPKDRELLGNVGHGVSEVINLGWFSPIAKILVSYLYVLYRAVGSWGWAIVLLTITVRLLLFPLSLQQIKSAAAMRKLKPEMDALNEKYKDDPAQRGVALQELWRKNKVANPLVGCFPVLVQMPVWFALYTALQTAVELYHTPFGPFIRDLASRDPYFVIPVILGASSFIQQKIMPPQGDPAQQKMMLYMMPAIFTAMMLFLPAGLGVYMLTNTWLGISQQVLVERYLKARDHAQGSGDIQVREKSSGDDDKATPALGKGKARVRG